MPSFTPHSLNDSFKPLACVICVLFVPVFVKTQSGNGPGGMCAHALLAMPCMLTTSAEIMRFMNFAIDSLEKLDDNEV